MSERSAARLFAREQVAVVQHEVLSTAAILPAMLLSARLQLCDTALGKSLSEMLKQNPNAVKPLLIGHSLLSGHLVWSRN